MGKKTVTKTSRTRRTKTGTITKITTIISEELGAKPASKPEPQVVVAPPPQPERVNHIIYLLDDSGSMSGCYSEAVRQLNANFANARVAAAATGQRTLVSLWMFGAYPGVRCIWDDIPVERISDLGTEFGSGSTTPLFEAVGAAIDRARAKSRIKDADETWLLVCATDGGENGSASRFGKNYGNQYDAAPFRRILEEAQATDRWTLAFLVPPGGKQRMVGWGVPAGNVIEWGNTVEGARQAFNSVQQATTSYYATRSAGHTNTKTFFTTDLSAITKADLAKMDDVSGQFKKWQVPREVKIQDFVESHNAKFVVGAGYYQLTKKEKLRAGRNVLVREKGTTRLFGGDQARRILGIPAGEVIVTPGNHSNYDVFFQSTSRNRDLVRGTDFLYDTAKAVDDPETWDSKGAEAAAAAKRAALDPSVTTA